MITPDQIIQLFQEFEILPPDVVLSSDTDLFSSGLDSMSMMQLIIQIEESHGISISPADITRSGFATPRSIAAFLSSYGPQSATV